MMKGDAMDSDKALVRYEKFLKHNGNSEKVIQMYYKRVRTFLGVHPEVLGANKEDMRQIIDDYIADLPVNTGLGVTATAVRYFWNSMFGERYFKRMQLKDFPYDQEIEDEAADFMDYLKDLGNLKENTTVPRVRMVKLFLYCQYSKDGFSRDKVCADDVRRHISETMSYVTASTKSGFSSNIRSYAKFLESKGHGGNAKAILRLPLRGPSPNLRLPKCISDEDFTLLLDSTEDYGVRGQRDKAILLLMGNLGLRSCDVSSLTLDDVDWARGVLHVRDSKSLSDRAIPLDSDTGSALETYVLGARQKGDGIRSLFLPGGNEVIGNKLTYRQIGHRIRHLAEKAGLSNYCGTHSLRRAVASNMTNNGVPIKTIADILGHELATTTMGYIRVNIASLRRAIGPWPEGGRL
jgi:site-specific recombinase XerD